MKIEVESIARQLHRNAVALISLVIAISSLGYNSWRNETSETQRNLRSAAFEIVSQLGELSAQVNQLGYGKNDKDVAWNRGWGNVLTLRTLSELLPPPVPAEVAALSTMWRQNVSALAAGDQAAIEKVRAQIDTTASAVISVIENLD